MRAPVFFVATSLFASGCLEESSCVLAPSWSFHVETCSTIPEEVSLSVDGACADATFRCVTPEPCTRWGVWAFQAGLCTVHLQAGEMTYSTSTELAFEEGCPRGFKPASGQEVFKLGPGCE
jgi:hypothetical protein